MSADEIVDEVSEGDVVLRQVSKLDAHRQGLLHRVVLGEVRDRSGRYVLARQSAGRQDAGQFVSPVGGHVRSGETLDEALMRETNEELGLEGFDFRPVGSFVFNRWVLNRWENHYFFLYLIRAEVSDIKLGDEATEVVAFNHLELINTLKERPDQFGEIYHVLWDRGLVGTASDLTPAGPSD